MGKESGYHITSASYYLERGLLAARQGDKHLVDETAEVGHAEPADGVLAHDDAIAEGLHGSAQAAADEAPRRAERPAPHACSRHRRCDQSKESRGVIHRASEGGRRKQN